MIRRSVAAIIFRKGRGVKKYLLLKRRLNWKGWEFMKGGCKLFESEDNCLVREVQEETGFSELLFEKTDYKYQFKYQKIFMKDNRLFSGAKNSVYLVEVFSSRVKLDKKEHEGFKWVSKKDVLKLLTWNDQKEMFKKLVK